MSKNGEKSLKPLSNDFHDQRLKNMCFQTVVLKNRVKTLSIVQNLLTNIQNCQTAQKLKRG